MRRSLRDSIVGFSLLGGLLVFTFFSFWLRGVKLSSKNWYLFAEFNNASGLSKKSPVTYRGILVGSIEDILFTNESIKAKIVLNNPDIILPKPAFARALITDQDLDRKSQPLLLFDEPTAGLDPIASTRIEDLINNTNDKANGSSIVVSHVLSTIERTSEKVVMLYGGKFRWAGSIDEFKESNDPYVFQFRNGNLAGPMQPKDI